MKHFESLAQELIQAGRALHQLGLVPATSGNFSARLDAHRIAITISGSHKGYLRDADIMLIDSDGRALDQRRPSAEAALHTQIYSRFEHFHAVLHLHSASATILSRLRRKRVVLQDYELLKAFDGIQSHQHVLTVPVFANSQNIDSIYAEVASWLDQEPQAYGYIIAGHGFYTWGREMQDALRHAEAFDYLFNCELRLMGVSNP